MARRVRGHAAILGYVCLATAAVWFAPPVGWVSALLLLPLTIVCPGYALVHAVEGRRESGSDALELAVLSLMASFAVAALGGLALYGLGLTLAAKSWSILILLITIASVAVALYRGTDRMKAPRLRLPAPTTLAIVVGACGLLATAGVVAWSSEKRLRHDGLVQQLAATRMRPGAIRVSVRNGETARVARYRVQVRAGNRTTSFELMLRPGESWSGIRHLGHPSRGPVTVRLFPAGASLSADRKVVVW